MDHLTSASWYTNYNGFGEFIGEVQGLPQMQLGVDTERQFTPHDHIQYPTPVTSVPGDGLQYVREPGVFMQEDVQQNVEEALPYPESHSSHHLQPNKMEKIIYIQQNTEDAFPCPESYTQHQHRPSKTGKIMCQECQATFACLANLRNHMRIHTGERPYVCEECGASFTQRSNLRSHKRVHTGERPYMCGICGQTFARSSHLPGHMRTHTGERPFKCSRCNRSFATNQIMKNHMRTHTGERPFVCEVCEATFAQSSCLATHKKIHTGERNFKCVRCGKAFISRSGLQTHERVHTGEKPYKCEKCSKSFKTSSYLSKHKQKYCGNSFASKVKTPDVKKSVRKPNGTRKIGKSRKAVKVAGKPPKRNKSKRLKPPRRHHGDEFGVDNTANVFSSPDCSTEEHFTAPTHLEVKPEAGSLNFASSKSNTNHTDLLDMMPPSHHLSKPTEEDVVEDFVKMEYHVYSGTDKDTLKSIRSLESQYNVQEVQSQFQEVPTQQQMDTVDPGLKDVVSHGFSEPSICPQGMLRGTQGIPSQSEGTLGIHRPLEGTLGIHSQAMQVLPPASSIAMGTVAQQSTFTSETDPVGWHSRNYM